MNLVKMQTQIARLLIVQVRARAAKARREGRSDVGASAIEWAIIAAICVGLALVIADVVRRVVESRESKIEDGID
ncbi:MAG: hypothetical protein L0K86_18680 [Actinomycetia bacterium]|nr:hypothetical protein [Actinomycetes bacterium]